MEILEDLPIECADSQFIRADDSVLVGFASKVVLSDTLEECVATCVKDPACKVGRFFMSISPLFLNVYS